MHIGVCAAFMKYCTTQVKWKKASTLRVQGVCMRTGHMRMNGFINFKSILKLAQLSMNHAHKTQYMINADYMQMMLLYHTITSRVYKTINGTQTI